MARQRAEIIHRAEEWLASHGELTNARRWAINQTRFEMARAVWMWVLGMLPADTRMQIDRNRSPRARSAGNERDGKRSDLAPTSDK